MSAPHFRPPNRLRTGRGVKLFFAAAEKSSHRASQKRRKLSAHFSRSSLTMPYRQGKRAFCGFHGPIFPKNRLYRWKREAQNKENAGHAVTTTWDGSATTRDGSAATSRASQQAWAKNSENCPWRHSNKAVWFYATHKDFVRPGSDKSTNPSQPYRPAGYATGRPVCGKGDTPFVSPNGYTVGIFVESHSIHG